MAKYAAANTPGAALEARSARGIYSPDDMVAEGDAVVLGVEAAVTVAVGEELIEVDTVRVGEGEVWVPVVVRVGLGVVHVPVPVRVCVGVAADERVPDGVTGAVADVVDVEEALAEADAEGVSDTCARAIAASASATSTRNPMAAAARYRAATWREGFCGALQARDAALAEWRYAVERAECANDTRYM